MKVCQTTERGRAGELYTSNIILERAVAMLMRVVKKQLILSAPLFISVLAELDRLRSPEA